MSDPLASVRVNGKGFDICQNPDGSYHTRYITPHGACSGPHSSPDAIQLLADLARLSDENKYRAAAVQCRSPLGQ